MSSGQKPSYVVERPPGYEREVAAHEVDSIQERLMAARCKVSFTPHKPLSLFSLSLSPPPLSPSKCIGELHRAELHRSTCPQQVRVHIHTHTRFSAFVCRRLRGGGWPRRARAITAPSKAAATTGVEIFLHTILHCEGERASNRAGKGRSLQAARSRDCQLGGGERGGGVIPRGRFHRHPQTP